MTEYANGIITGLMVGSLVGILAMLKYALTELSIMKLHIAAMLTLMIKVEKTSQATMEASEGFMDGLRQSAEQMQGPSSSPPPFMQNRRDHFQDLRNRFEEGINRLEGQDDDDNDDEQGPPENWKKK